MLWLLLACGTPLDPPTDAATDTGTPDSGDTDSGDSGDTDSGDTDSGDTDITVDDDGDFLYAGGILSFGLALDDAAIASLTADPTTDVHATFTFQDESFDVGVHLKGSNGSFRDLTEKAGFKVDFHQWDDTGRFHGVKRLTLNNMVQDATMSSEHAAYQLYADLGLVAPRHGYAEVSVNGELFGLYGIVESMDEQFVNRNWDHDDTGNLYEGGYGADVKHGRVDNFEQKEGDVTDRADLAELIDTMDATTPDDFFTTLGTFFDTDALLDMWATELVIADVDAYTTLANNYLLYHAPDADQWTMIPWGPDQAFADEMDVHMDSYYGDLTIRCAAAPDCAAALDDRIQHVLDVWDSAGFADFVAAETARVEDACRTDPRSPWGDYGCRDAQAAMRDWVEARPAQVEAQLAGG
jgi:spore coat protein CotH